MHEIRWSLKLASLVGVALALGGWTHSESIAAVGTSSVSQGSPLAYDDWFTQEAMRVDLFHSGVDTESAYSLDEIVWEPLWPGTRRYLIDPFDFGTYRFRVTDRATSQEIFRLGFATLFEEWTGTGEAKNKIRRTMHESIRFPWPKQPVTVTIDHRSRNGKFEPMYRLDIDPRSHQILRVRKHTDFEVVSLTPEAKDPAHCLDIVIIPEGYAREDDSKLRADLQRFTEAFVSTPPWTTMKDMVCIRGIVAYSNASGVSEPRKGVFVDTLLGASFNTFDSPRYLTLQHTKTMREVASLAPYDAVFVMVNSARYGGGGVFNQWAVFTSDNEYDDYVMLHEFGHSMAGLGDEYYDSAISMDEDTMYPPGVEPWEPNITAFVGQRRTAIPWADLIEEPTPVPTPETEEYASVVGLFEGAGYKAKGLYRPQADCKMFHKGLVPFCHVCARSIQRMARYHAGMELNP